jgi:drug/metabolite transporter (DMT)-like permease
LQVFSNWKSSSRLALSAMLVVTAIWGWTFVVVQNAVAKMPVMDFLAWRFALAAAMMIIIRPNCFKGMTKKELGRGIILGCILGLGYITQTFGLERASASVTGFITGMFVVFTPLISWLFLRRRIAGKTWIAVVLATVGLALLGLHGWSMGLGELLTLGCALCYALHIVGLGEWSTQYDIYRFSVLQILVVAVITVVSAIPGGITLPPEPGVWGAVVITGVLATALAFFVQTWAQSLVIPARISIVMTMEPVFAGVFGVLLAGNTLNAQIVSGMLCVLIAMFMVQIDSVPRFLRFKKQDQ